MTINVVIGLNSFATEMNRLKCQVDVYIKGIQQHIRPMVFYKKNTNKYVCGHVLLYSCLFVDPVDLGKPLRSLSVVPVRPKPLDRQKPLR